MKTIAQLLSTGISTLADLRESLQLAIQLEFATIPPYLCAEWSIRDGGDVQTMIHEIVMAEMSHMGLACNMLTAIGGSPSLANASFPPAYPVTGLPGNVHPDLVIDLLPLGPTALQTFLGIEKPAFSPVATASTQIFPTIGEFYDAIATAFHTLQPAITGAHQVQSPVGIFPVTSIADALKAIELIKEQGEGTEKSPFSADFDPNSLAHYYSFLEIAKGHKLRQAPDGTWNTNGDALPLPAVFAFTQSADPGAAKAFNSIFSDLLRLLEKAWTVDAQNISLAVGKMFELANEGVRLITAGIRPEFRWVDGGSPLSSARAFSAMTEASRSGGSTQILSGLQVMRVAVRQGSHAEAVARSRSGVIPAALAPGFPATPAHDLIFHSGATIRNLMYFNLFVGGTSSWDTSDAGNINAALAAAMSDRRLNNMMQQYFTSQITSQALGSTFLTGRKPAVVSQGDIEDLVRQLGSAQQLKTPDISRTVFNFLLPPGTLLNDNPGVTTNQLARSAALFRDIPREEESDSTNGLGGYHGSVHVGTQKFYYAIGVFSESRPDGTSNGIPVFDQSWKNVVATFYHELQEARTDPDVEDATRNNDNSFLGWTSRQGEECGDFPVFEANPITRVFQEVALANGGGTVPVQFQYSNAVHGPEGPIEKAH